MKRAVGRQGTQVLFFLILNKMNNQTAAEHAWMEVSNKNYFVISDS